MAGADADAAAAKKKATANRKKREAKKKAKQKKAMADEAAASDSMMLQPEGTMLGETHVGGGGRRATPTGAGCLTPFHYNTEGRDTLSLELETVQTAHTAHGIC
jgi:membrane protein involved in colicin uptake